MFPNEENFEKLEAYIDGVLDASDQAEIERLLAANPQLRAMVADLMKGRQMLMALPRVSAPPDVAETFQGHLERAALLGDDESQDASSSMRIHRWPQLLSIAAVLLLALGLFAVIYQILPKKHADQIVMKNPSAAPELERSKASEDKFAGSKMPSGGVGGGGGGGGFGGVADDQRLSKSGGDALAQNGGRTMTAGKPGNGEEFAGGGAKDGSRGFKKGGDLATGVADDRAHVSAEELRHMQELAQSNFRFKNIPSDAKGVADGAAQGAASDEPVVFFVNAKFPKLAAEDVSDYLTKNDVPFVSVPEGLDRLESVAGNSARQEAQFQQLNQQAPLTSAAKPDNNGDAFRDGAGVRRKIEMPGNYGQNSNLDAANGLNNTTTNGAANASGPGNTTAPSDPAYARGGAQQMQRAGNSTDNSASLNSAEANGYDLKRARENSQRREFGAQSAQQQAVVEQAGRAPQTRSAQADSLANATNFGGNYMNSSNPYGVTGTYRAMLTTRQLTELNERISRRGNQWAEVRGEMRSDASLPRLEAGIIANNAAPNAAVQEKLGSEKSKVAQVRDSDHGKIASDAAEPRRSADIGGNSDKEAFGTGFPTTRPAGSAIALGQPPPGPIQSLAASQPNSAAAAPALSDRALSMKAERLPGAPESSEHPSPLRPSAEGEANKVMAKQLQAQAKDLALDDDEPREVLIVVNDQPIDLPAVLPTAQPSAPATTAPALPTTAPSTPPADQQVK